MAVSTHTVDDSDNQTRSLQDTVLKSRKALQYWQALETEYEGFKEEIERLEEIPTSEDMQAVASDFGGDILTPKECQEILTADGKGARTRTQVISILSRRIDYVQENVKTILKRLTTAESELTSLAGQFDEGPREDDALQLHEITEILDENDNVISSTVTDAKTVAPEILEVLRKSGVKSLPDPATTHAPAEEVVSRAELPRPATSSTISAESSQFRPSETSSLAEGVGVSESKPGAQSKGSPNEGHSVDAVVGIDRDPGSRPSTDHEDFPSDPIIPENESPEEAALRREMLQYNMNEMGAIVATMDLEDPASDNADEDNDFYDEDYDEDYEDDDDDDDDDYPEDEYGRTTVRVIDDEYRREMLELEARLNAKALVNVGPDVPTRSNLKETLDLKKPTTAGPKAGSQPHDEQTLAMGKKKGVRFAQSLDIAEEQPSTPANLPVPSDLSPAERPISDIVVERTSPTNMNENVNIPAARTSKFKSMRAASKNDESNPRPQPSTKIQLGPLAGMQSSFLTPLHTNKAKPVPPETTDGADRLTRKIHSNVIERPRDQVHANVTEPDEFDPNLMSQQVSAEYDKMRDRLFQKSGAKHHEGDLIEEGESGRNMSRFKASRLSKSTK